MRLYKKYYKHDTKTTRLAKEYFSYHQQITKRNLDDLIGLDTPTYKGLLKTITNQQTGKKFKRIKPIKKFHPKIEKHDKARSKFLFAMERIKYVFENIYNPKADMFGHIYLNNTRMFKVLIGTMFVTFSNSIRCDYQLDLNYHGVAFYGKRQTINCYVGDYIIHTEIRATSDFTYSLCHTIPCKKNVLKWEKIWIEHGLDLLRNTSDTNTVERIFKEFWLA